MKLASWYRTQFLVNNKEIPWAEHSSGACSCNTGNHAVCGDEVHYSACQYLRSAVLHLPGRNQHPGEKLLSDLIVEDKRRRKDTLSLEEELLTYKFLVREGWRSRCDGRPTATASSHTRPLQIYAHNRSTFATEHHYASCADSFLPLLILFLCRTVWMKPTGQICSWIRTQWGRVTCSQTRTHFWDVYSDTSGEVRSSSSTTRLNKIQTFFSFPQNMRLKWFPLLLRLSSSLNHPIFTPDVTTASPELPELFLDVEFRGRVWHTCTTFLWANSNTMLGLAAESVANDGCCSATCCEAARKCQLGCISTIHSFYRQNSCKCSLTDHLSMETACSHVIRMQNLSGIYVEIYIHSLRNIWKKIKWNITFFNQKKSKVDPCGCF